MNNKGNFWKKWFIIITFFTQISKNLKLLRTNLLNNEKEHGRKNHRRSFPVNSHLGFKVPDHVPKINVEQFSTGLQHYIIIVPGTWYIITKKE